MATLRAAVPLLLWLGLGPGLGRAAPPVVLWHGMGGWLGAGRQRGDSRGAAGPCRAVTLRRCLAGDSCCNPRSMGYIRAVLQRRLPGTYVLALRLGASPLQVAAAAGGGGGWAQALTRPGVPRGAPGSCR